MLTGLSKYFWGHPVIALLYVYDKHQSWELTLNFILDETPSMPRCLSNCRAGFL